MWTWRRMEKISWLDKVTNEEVLGRVNKDRQILNSIWQKKHRWIGYVLRHDGLLHEITEGRKKGKQTTGRKIQMLHNLANDGGFVALKWAAEDREVWRHREGMSETCCTALPVNFPTNSVKALKGNSLQEYATNISLHTQSPASAVPFHFGAEQD